MGTNAVFSGHYGWRIILPVTLRNSALTDNCFNPVTKKPSTKSVNADSKPLERALNLFVFNPIIIFRGCHELQEGFSG